MDEEAPDVNIELEAELELSDKNKAKISLTAVNSGGSIVFLEDLSASLEDWRDYEGYYYCDKESDRLVVKRVAMAEEGEKVEYFYADEMDDEPVQYYIDERTDVNQEILPGEEVDVEWPVEVKENLEKCKKLAFSLLAGVRDKETGQLVLHSVKYQL